MITVNPLGAFLGLTTLLIGVLIIGYLARRDTKKTQHHRHSHKKHA